MQIRKVLLPFSLVMLLACGNSHKSEFQNLYEDEMFEECIAQYEAFDENERVEPLELYYVALCYEALSKPCDAVHLLYECRDSGDLIPELNEKIAKTEALVLLSNCNLINDADERRFYRSPIFTSHYVEKYHFYYTNNYLDSAVMALKAAIETKPQDASLYHELSRVYIELNQFDSALTEQNKAIALRPDEAIFIANRGNVYLGLGRRDDAINDVKSALKIDSSDCEIYNFLIDLLKESGNTAEIKYWIARRPQNCE